MKIRWFQTYNSNGLNSPERLQYWDDEESKWLDVPLLRIPEKEMKTLMSLKKIEMRSSCEGSENYGPFFIFRFVDNKDKKFINLFCDYMMYKDSSTLCKFGIGRVGEFRIIVTGNFFKDLVTKTEYNNWWKNVTKKMEHFCKVN